MKVVLKLQNGTQVLEISLEPNIPVTLGRSSKANLTLDDKLLSGLHCKFILLPQKLMLFDLQSKNGTYLNGIPVDKQTAVFIGDEIKIGSTKISFLTTKMDPEAVNALTYDGTKFFREAKILKLKS